MSDTVQKAYINMLSESSGEKKTMSDSELAAYFNRHKRHLGDAWLEHPDIVDARPDTSKSHFVNAANEFAKKHGANIKFHDCTVNDDDMDWVVSDHS